ncbi:hypothetical protein SAMN05444920_12481 [Nonomuraea solani]|uniref:Uncharacterized protein n=1 Tax=Nonomuraea solani TaxID=1144553 RepID=A0A1H6EYU9_9ACTN|nr:hypothetical protein SAMN05444920_12481 [Nonomuraea solani]
MGVQISPSTMIKAARIFRLLFFLHSSPLMIQISWGEMNTCEICVRFCKGQKDQPDPLRYQENLVWERRLWLLSYPTT